MQQVKLPKEFYTQSDTLHIAKSLLGKMLVTRFEKKTTGGIITETEAYCGTDDRGCHAYSGRYTQRTKVMYAEGGVSYVYLCYGIHRLFNVVTHKEGEPHAVLIRAIQPVTGLPFMLQRRGVEKFTPALGAGPGLVTRCLGIQLQHNGSLLNGHSIWIEDRDEIPLKNIIESPRVGMHFDGYYKTVPWRFRIAGSPYTSRAK
ncbi:MAG: DNA-3-methyladenine glycosylase [Chitinophagales bacterium]